MKALKITVLGILCYVLSTPSIASDLVHEFSNPSFSGNGYSTHVLSLEQLRYSREKQIKDDQKSAEAAAERDENNTTINKFIKNVESRIYANLSKQLVDNMFGEGSATSGTAEIEDNIVYWEKVDDNINIRITESDGTVTTMSVPVGDFAF